MTDKTYTDKDLNTFDKGVSAKDFLDSLFNPSK